jgi:hypothetical protein
MHREIYIIQGIIHKPIPFIATDQLLEVSNNNFNDLARRVIHTLRNGIARGQKLDSVRLITPEGRILWQSEFDKEDLILKETI